MSKCKMLEKQIHNCVKLYELKLLKRRTNGTEVKFLVFVLKFG